MRQIDHVVYIWGRTLSLLGKACPRLSIAVAVLTFLEAIASVAMLYVIKLLVDTISRELAAQDGLGAERVIPALVFTGTVIVLTVLVQNVGNMLRLRQGLRVSEFVDREIHDKAISVDLQFYESPLYYDALERARHGGAQRPVQLVSNMILMAKAAVELAGVLFLLAAIDFRLIPILLLPVFLTLLVKLYYTRKLFDWRMARAQMDRRTSYLDWMLTSAQNAKELRLSRIGPYLRDKYHELKSRVSSGQIRIEQARLITELATAILGAVVFIVASAWLLQESLAQRRPIGDVVLFVLLLRRAEGSGNELVASISRMVDDQLYLRSLFAFLSTKPLIQIDRGGLALPSELSVGLKLSDVSFTYAGAKAPALHDVSIEIRPGQIVALVGENGSGKTTLIKLLTRLYDPTTGSVTLDGADIRRFDATAYRNLFSVIFQDYAMYAETAEDNIRFGDIGRSSWTAHVPEAAHQAGAADFVERLPQSYKTQLTKLFDHGHDLSIGQWQRLALARAFYPRSKFLILDEPTSAVDPKAEFELFEKFRDRIGGRGALLISHRLSTVRLADYTYVLEGGRIVESGAHEELIAAKGKYADLFEKQARAYQ